MPHRVVSELVLLDLYGKDSHLRSRSTSSVQVPGPASTKGSLPLIALLFGSRWNTRASAMALRADIEGRRSERSVASASVSTSIVVYVVAACETNECKRIDYGSDCRRLQDLD